MEIIDISVGLREGMPVYPGNEPFLLTSRSRIADGGSSNTSEVRVGTHTGTHVDAPHHIKDGAQTVEAMDLAAMVGSCRVVEIEGDAIGAEEVSGTRLDGATRVLFRTSNSGLWEKREFERGFVHLTESGARAVAQRGVRLVGVDYLSVDRFRSGTHPAHHVLIDAGVTIVEGLSLGGVEPGEYFLVVAPLKIVGGDGAPARAFLLQGRFMEER